jgi:hypothetical protein
VIIAGSSCGCWHTALDRPYGEVIHDLHARFAVRQRYTHRVRLNLPPRIDPMGIGRP